MQNEKLLANDTSIKEKTQSDYKIKRNWLTEEGVASQLNKDFKDLTTEDFEHIIKIDF